MHTQITNLCNDSNIQSKYTPRHLNYVQKTTCEIKNNSYLMSIGTTFSYSFIVLL